MGKNTKLMEPLLEKTADLAITTLQLAKLKAIDKTSDVVSSFVPHWIVLVILTFFMVFLSIGLSMFISEIVGKTWSGFIIVAGFYALVAFILHFFMHKRIKKHIRNYVIRQLLK
jgi:fatty acid desaturase